MNKYISVFFFVVLISISMSTSVFAQDWANNPTMNSSSAPAAKPAPENAPATAPQGTAANLVVVRIEQPAPRRGAAKSGGGAVSREAAARKSADDELRKQIDQWKAELDASNLSQDQKIQVLETRIANLESRGVPSTDPIVIELRKEIETIREAQESRDFWLWVVGIVAFVALLVAVFAFFARSSSKNEVSNSTTPASPVNVKVKISVNGGPSGQPMTGNNTVDVAVNGKSSDKPADRDNKKQIQEKAPVSVSRPVPRERVPEEGVTIPYGESSEGDLARRLGSLVSRVYKVEDRLDDAQDDIGRLSDVVAKVGDKVDFQAEQSRVGFDRLFAQLDELVKVASAPATVPPVSKPAASVPECPPEDGVTVPFVAAGADDVPARPPSPKRPAASTSTTPATASRPKKEPFKILEVIPSILPLSGGVVRILVDEALPVEAGGRIQCGAVAYTTKDYEVLEGNVIEVLFKDHPPTMDYEAGCLKPIRVSYYSKDGKQATKADAIIFDDETAGLGTTPELEKVTDEPAKAASGDEPFNTAIADALKAAAASPADPNEAKPPIDSTPMPKGKGSKNKAAAKA